jgi:plastocyanin
MERSDRGGRNKAVTIAGLAFEPVRTFVDRGATVRWANSDGVMHTVTSGTPGKQGVPGVSGDTKANLDGLFDAALDGGENVVFTFRESGTFPYFCKIHTSMRGRVLVR